MCFSIIKLSIFINSLYFISIKSVLTFNKILCNVSQIILLYRKISFDKVQEKLTEKETEILWKLLNKIDHKIPQKELLREIWGYDESIETRTLETHIYRIRKKLNSIGAKDYKINNIDNSYILSLKKLN